jgi:tyrosyl-tRNA synthetase
MDASTKLDLITRDLQEVVGTDELVAKLNERNITIYWGTAPTGIPHLGYFVPLLKIADFLAAGCKVKILVADLHAYLDNMKSTWQELEYKTQYYEFIIKEILTQVGVPLEKLEFVKGREFQLHPEYSLDVYKMTAITSTNDTQRAGAEVVKQVENPRLSGLLYPILQALDEQYLEADAQFGGLDQRKILMFAREFLPKIGYEKRVELMNPLVPGLGKDGKMSSSEPNSKIDFTDTDKKIKKKINKAACVDGEVEGNGLLALLKYVLLKYDSSEFVIDRPEQYGGRISFADYDAVVAAFSSKELSSVDLKQGIADRVVSLVAPIREKVHENKELLSKAYPELILE